MDGIGIKRPRDDDGAASQTRKRSTHGRELACQVDTPFETMGLPDAVSSESASVQADFVRLMLHSPIVILAQAGRDSGRASVALPADYSSGSRGSTPAVNLPLTTASFEQSGQHAPALPVLRPAPQPHGFPPSLPLSSSPERLTLTLSVKVLVTSHAMLRGSKEELLLGVLVCETGSGYALTCTLHRWADVKTVLRDAAGSAGAGGGESDAHVYTACARYGLACACAALEQIAAGSGQAASTSARHRSWAMPLAESVVTADCDPWPVSSVWWKVRTQFAHAAALVLAPAVAPQGMGLGYGWGTSEGGGATAGASDYRWGCGNDGDVHGKRGEGRQEDAPVPRWGRAGHGTRTGGGRPGSLMSTDEGSGGEAVPCAGPDCEPFPTPTGVAFPAPSPIPLPLSGVMGGRVLPLPSLALVHPRALASVCDGWNVLARAPSGSLNLSSHGRESSTGSPLTRLQTRIQALRLVRQEHVDEDL